VVLTASVLRIYVTWQVINVKLPDNDKEMLKACWSVHYTKRYCCDMNCAFVGCNKNNYFLIALHFKHF